MQITVDQIDRAGFLVKKTGNAEPQQNISQIVQSLCDDPNASDWGLFRRKSTLRWLRDNRTVSSYELSSQDCLELRPKARDIKVNISQSIMCIRMDYTWRVDQVTKEIAKRFCINYKARDQLGTSNSRLPLSNEKRLCEQGITENSVLHYLMTSEWADRRNLDYIEKFDGLLKKLYERALNKSDVVYFVPLLAQSKEGNWKEERPIDYSQYLPVDFKKYSAELIPLIEKRHKKRLVGMSSDYAKITLVRWAHDVERNPVANIERTFLESGRKEKVNLVVSRESIGICDGIAILEEHLFTDLEWFSKEGKVSSAKFKGLEEFKWESDYHQSLDETYVTMAWRALDYQPKKLNGKYYKNSVEKKTPSLPQVIKKEGKVTFRIFDVEGKQKVDVTVPKERKEFLRCSESVSSMTFSMDFVNAVVYGYNNHTELIVRPDDIWLSIVLQFAKYLNGRSEELRSKFVDFEGKKTNSISTGGSLMTSDLEELADLMTKQMSANIKDPSIRDWMIPDFSTTTSSDKMIGSIALMAAMKDYFRQEMHFMCGIPFVTMMGTVDDWKQIRKRADRLLEFDDEKGHLKMLSNMLIPVLDELVASAQGNPNHEWWKGIIYDHHGSGTPHISGWLIAFCAFGENGEWLLGDGKINTSKLPVGTVTVPVHINDNGNKFETELVGGHVTARFHDPEGEERAVRLEPQVGWYLAKK